MTLLKELLVLIENQTEQENEKEIRGFLRGLEDDVLDHKARFKQFDLSVPKKTVWWVTQETNEAESQGAAQDIADAFSDEGYEDWTINVVVRDEYNGKLDSPWKTAISQ